ncbi:hypothetical protein OJJOAM_004462 [Cupriavidus sp. H18C1]
MTFNPSKRQFLKASLGTGAAAAVLASFPPSIRRALAIEAHNATGTIKDVKHVVMVMLENRSFDSYFGTFKGVRGYGDRFPIPLRNGRTALYQTDANGNILTPYHLDESIGNAQRAGGTPHNWADSQAAWDHGRMDRWPVAKQPLSMGYYDEAEVTFQRALADAFTLCDAYHCGIHTGTIANRLFYWTGSNGPTGDNVAVTVNEFNGGADVGPSTEGWTWDTYADRLQAAGVSWKVYQNIPDNFGCNQMMSFRHWRAEMEKMPAGRQVSNTNAPGFNPPYDPAIDDRYSPFAKGFCNTMADGGFLQSLRDDVQNGRLPEVSWIIPPAEFSEHPGPSSPAKGGWYVQAILDALTSDPEVWSKTALIINYDENDGFFDHLPPPTAPSRNPDGTVAGKSTLSDAQMAFEYHDYQPATPKQPARDGRPYGPGPRVPMWIVSPWSRGGWVNSEVFDHTSVIRFLEARFGVMEPQISPYRRAVCGGPDQRVQFRDAEREPAAGVGGPHHARRSHQPDGRAAGHAEDPGAGHAGAAGAGPGHASVARAALRTAHQRARRCPQQSAAAAVCQRQRAQRRRRVPRLRPPASGPHSAPHRGRGRQDTRRRLGYRRGRRQVRPVGAGPERLSPQLRRRRGGAGRGHAGNPGLLQPLAIGPPCRSSCITTAAGRSASWPRRWPIAMTARGRAWSRRARSSSSNGRSRTPAAGTTSS